MHSYTRMYYLFVLYLNNFAANSQPPPQPKGTQWVSKSKHAAPGAS